MNKPSNRTRNRPHAKNINLRVKSNTRSLIDRACAITDKTVTEFVLDAACREAEDVLLDRRLFDLDKKEYQSFINALDAPTKSNTKLKALLRRKPLWEK